MRGKPYAARLGRLVYSLCILGLLVISSVISYQFAAKYLNIPRIPKPSGRANIETAYPSSTNLCSGGCKPHQNWVEFYLPSGSFHEDSLRLKTSIFIGEILTIGISSTPCEHQERAGYTCIDMELSHRLLSALTGLGLTPLRQLRDTNNWWLEYTQIK